MKRLERSALVVVGAAVGVLLLLSRCQKPVSHGEAPKQQIATSSTATASVSTKAEQLVRVTVRKPVRPSGKSLQERPATGSINSGEVYGSEEELIIVVESTQSTSAQAAATSQASATMSAQLTEVNVYARAGVVLISAPGVIALDYQFYTFTVPEWLLGVKLDVGTDVEANLQQAGVGLSVGNKAFATGGVYAQYDLRGYGYYVGAGLRF